MKIDTREATRYLWALLDIYPYFHICRSIQVKLMRRRHVFSGLSVFVSFVTSRTKSTILNLYYYYYYCCYFLSFLCTVFTFIYLKQTMFLGYIALQLFYSYNFSYM